MEAITDGTLLSRLFSGLLEKRIRAFVILSESQKSFVKGNECFVNTLLLHDINRRGKKSLLAGVVLDVSRAFDSVPHDALMSGLRGKGVPCIFAILYRLCFGGCIPRLRTVVGSGELSRGVSSVTRFLPCCSTS